MLQREIDVLVGLINLRLKADIFDRERYEKAISLVLPDSYMEQLSQLCNKPVFDGDTISPSQKSTLVNLGLAFNVSYNFKEGYTSASLLGLKIYKLKKAIDNEQVL